MVKKEKSLGDYKGCKILLTSRDKKVLFDKMDVKLTSIFCVEKLDDKDALMLFKRVAGISDNMSKFKQKIVKKYCAGLPMAIVTVGRALRNKSESVSEATLEKLKKKELMGVQKSMEISVKMSYDHLESEELKSIFLLCAQMGHQPLIMDLVKYCFGLGILEGVYTLREARDRIYASIQKLKDSSLLLDGSSSDNFKMHDMVRDAALSIAHKEQNVFTLRNGKLDDWPDKDELERCTAISIDNCDIIDELPKVINCPQLKFFQIASDDPSLKIPENFFEGMEKLRVLILNGIHLPCLPSSIKSLLNFRMLCLERCTLVENLSIIGELKKLRILSFSGSQIEELPAQLGCLVKLQLLDISQCLIGKGIPPNFMSSLTCLEELYIRKSLMKIEEEGEANQSHNSFLSELKHLHQLKIVDLCIPSAAVLPRNLFFDKLDDYKILIGDLKMLSVGDFRMPDKYEASRSLALQLKDDTQIHSQKGIKLLFRRVENLLLGELNGVKNVFYELNLDGFQDLKHLSIINNGDIEYIIKSMELSQPQDAFPNLESLCLYKLSDLKMICCSPVTDASFSKLKTIKVKMCTHLKSLFSFYMVKLLASLETIDVSECDSLEEIVIDGRQVNSEKVEFHKLRSLTLQSLPLFTSFYTNVQTANRDHIEITNAEDGHYLFSKMVEVPNLERLKLSSIKIHKIWSDKPLSSFCFQNLIKLTVEGCYNLEYLCSLAVASSLKKLKGLFVSDCPKMKKIFSTDGNSEDKVCIFPKLEEIRLTEMNMLTDIWQAEIVGADSFSSLISVHIERCRKLDKIFPSHMEGWFRTLNSLKVVDCKSVEVIFEVQDFQRIDAPRIDTKLQLILVHKLPNLKQVWSRDPGRILNFKNLRSIEVLNCDKLSSVLPASVAKDLEKLEDLSVWFCLGIMEIVAGEDGSETSNKPLEFPEVTSITLCGLPEIKRFYMGRHTIECPKLKRLSVLSCPKLQTFTTETTNEEGNAVFSAEKVISNLENIVIGFKEAKWLQLNIGKYRMHRLKRLGLQSLTSIELFYWFLQRMPNLEMFGGDIEELVPGANIAPQERLGTVLQLKELGLFSSPITDLGFERDPVLQRLELLKLDHCPNLINLVPSSVSLTHLTYLEVTDCFGLINLIASSTAKSLVQLRTMKVIRCKKVKEIVTHEGNEVIEIVFSKLISIELASLKYLTSFCSYKNCEFKFPSLEKLIVRDCPMMKTFTESHPSAPKLPKILAIEGEEEEEEQWHWEDDLNATIQKVFKDKVSWEYTVDLKLSEYPELIEQVWHSNDLVHENRFRYLKSLVAADCNNLVHVIPSHLLPCFKNLEELEIRHCREVQVIFNINEIKETKALRVFSLKKLSLIGLPKLEHVWDKDPEGIIGLHVLKDVQVERCNSLKILFPASMAKDLTTLEVLKVTYCAELVEIFSKYELTAEGAEFVFNCLTTLVLKELPGLKCFYPGLHTLELPVLEELEVYPCGLVILKSQEDHPEAQVLIQIEKVIQIPSLEKLAFCIGDYYVSWNRVSRELGFGKLPRFQEESDSVLYDFLQMLPNIEKLLLSGDFFEEIFSAEPNAVYTRVLSHLKGFRLLGLDNLNSIGLEHSWLHPFPENLDTFEVKHCGHLINLVPCTVSFSNLTHLKVRECKSLLYLLTSSTAKSLARLKMMEIIFCESMQEIVSREGDESHEDEQIIFGQLQDLYLKDLPKLRCFYQGNSTLCFPSLENVSIISCSWMNTFCPFNVINPDKLSSGVRFIKDETPRWEDGLNPTLDKTFEEQISKKARDISHLDLRESTLQEIWHGLLPVPDMCFSNLEELIVDGCQFLSDVLPSNLLPFLTKLERLEVRNCSSVKTIFDVKCITEDRKMKTMEPALLPLPFSFKKLILEQLPNLENVWNEDPHGFLRVQLLQEVVVKNCKCLTSLFPASVAKDLVKLENLVLEHCEWLMVIVSEDNADPKGTNLELTFPCMTSLTLLDLPNFKYFYSSMHWDMLKITYQEPHTEDQVCIEKLTPNLQCLSLGEKELKTIWHGQFRGNLLHKLKVLVVLYFHIESDVLPYGFLQQVPNMEISTHLVVSSSSFKEIFCFQKPNVDFTGFLSQLKVLKLKLLWELISIGLEHSWIEPFIRNLETLKVTRCSLLRNLAPSLVCFSNLMFLYVSKCDGLVNLFTSSTAKSLGRLKLMSIRRCQSIQEIVSKEGNESHDDKIIFWELQTLNLEYLPNLTSFYNGSFTLSFPSLEELSVFNCHRMETFCPGTINADKLLRVKFKKNIDAIPLEIDLNSTIRKAFLAAAESGEEEETDSTDSDEEE